MTCNLWPQTGSTYVSEDGVTLITSAGVSVDTPLSPYYQNAVRAGRLLLQDPQATGTTPVPFPPSRTVNVRAYGAKGDGASFDDSAVEAAIAFARVAKCAVYFPPGTYRLANGPDVSSAQSVQFVGDTSANPGGTGGSTVVLAAGATRGFDCGSSYGVSFRNLNVLAEAGFSAALLDFSSPAESPGGYHQIADCHLNILGGTGTLLDTRNTFNGSVTNSLFGFCSVAVRGPASFSDFANSWTFRNCSNVYGAVEDDVYLNPGQGWSWVGCSFEGLADGSANGIRVTNVFQSASVVIDGCWFGDCEGGAWVSGAFSGLTATGNKFEAGTPTTVGFDLVAATVGFTSKGNTFLGLAAAYDFNTDACYQVDCTSNSYVSCTAIALGRPVSGRVDNTASLAIFAGAETADYTRLRARLTDAPQSVPDNTVTLLSFVTDYDPNGNVSASRYTVPQTGYYQINGSVELQQSTSYVRAYLYKNGSNILNAPTGAGSAASTTASSAFSDIVRLEGGDIVDVRCIQETGGSVPVFFGAWSIHYLSS